MFINKIVYIFLLCFLIAAQSEGQSISLSENTSLYYSGQAGNNFWYFPKKAPDPSFPETVNSISAQLDLILRFDLPIEIRLNKRVQFDPENSDRNRYEIDDFYIDYYQDWYEVRAGLQIFSWKTVESISHADFLNQTDLESDFLDADKFSQLALRLRYITEGNSSFELHVLPHMRATRFPVGDNRYSFGLNISNDKKSHIYQADQKEWRPQFAISYLTIIADMIDTRLFYFNGYNRFPGIVPKDPTFTEFIHAYRLVDKAGATFQGELDAWLLKGELVYTKYQKDVMNQLGQSITPEYFAYTLGFEYTLYSLLIDNHDLGTILEIIDDTDSEKKPEELESFRPFQNHLFGGMRYTFNNVSDRAFLIGGIYDYKNEDLLLNIEYSERLWEVFTFKLTYTDLMADTSPLDQFQHTDRISAELLYNF